MDKILAWTLCIYALLKLAHLVVKPAPGYVEGSPTVADLIHAGEPTLLILSLTLGASITLYTNWWIHRFGTRQVAHGMDCYVALETARSLYRGEPGINPDAIGDEARIVVRNAEKHGAWIGMRPDTIRRDFERARIAYFNRYRAASPQGEPRITPALLHKLDLCFNEIWEPHGDILNP